MGRQYNYFITPEEEQVFLENLLDDNYLVVYLEETGEGKKRQTYRWRELEIDDILGNNGGKLDIPSKTYIYKKEWGELKYNKKDWIDMLRKSPVIEQWHCGIYEEERRLSRGRLYLDTWYKDEIESFDTVCKAFQKLVRVMKKTTIYKSYEFKNGKKLYRPASQKVIDLIEKNNYRAL